ncbi:MAG: AAA family ATPase, partial [Burkholderiaceae bacterium]|nr:AAA family ATPase [Burkholderiaceae bacterium]
MAKAKTQFVCSECGGASLKWQGQCPHCQAWNSLTEARVEPPGEHRYAALVSTAAVQSLGDVQAREMPRIASGIDEFDRVLGGGFVEGGVVLIGGDPGIGKSTLLLQSLAALSASAPVLYVSGEESAAQVALRARRLGVDAVQVRLLSEISLERIIS